MLHTGYKKIIIWGFPHYSDTFSYVWHGFFKAFKHLGYQVFWFDDNNYPSSSDFDYSNSIFLCEGYNDKNIPVLKDGIYFVHTLCKNPQKYVGNTLRTIDIRYGCDYQDNSANYSYWLDRWKCQEIGPHTFYERGSDYDSVYMFWATDLLPDEINTEDCKQKRESVFYFVGTIYTDKYQNTENLNKFIDVCRYNKISYQHIDPWIKPITHEENRKLMSKCYLAPDIRGKQNIDCGYIPCRIFKNISYGQLGMTNSRAIYSIMDDSIVYHPDVEQLFYLGEKYKTDFERIKHQMNLVSTKHTYINRANSLLSIL
jgi:hypothetical protein